ncbi:VOC family protein [Cellulomonas endophytica]|uniref:VOC family protein n=1 Tax=Cellulomonas endophytica TaxID=2494735 RepID=UPI0010109C1A|nr:VOC family protein [Cellulomonas endophytica]
MSAATPGRSATPAAGSPARPPMAHPVPLARLLQVAIVVEDVEAALDHWCRLLDVERPEVRVSSKEPNPDETYRGDTAAYSLKLAVIECPERGLVLELQEPDENPSTFREFLTAHGPGVHHLGFVVGDERDAVVEELQAEGYALRTVGFYPGGSWTVVDAEARLGVNLNIKPRP